MTTHMRTFPRESLDEMIEYLAAAYPKAFFTQSQLKIPLKKNIILDLEKDRVLDDEKRQSAVRFYQQDWGYQRMLVAGAKRIDLNGQTVGTVTEQEEIEARKRVQTEKQEHREKVKTQSPITVVRNLHANGKISTDQLSKITAPPLNKEIPMVKTKTPEHTPTPAPTNGAGLAQLRALWAYVDALHSQTNATLQAAVTAAALKVFVAEANKLIATLEEGAQQ
jgi:sRNA-binding protein